MSSMPAPEIMQSGYFGGLLGEARRPRIMFVDDDPVSLELLESLFEDDHEVVTLGSGALALEACLAAPPDLLIMDVLMPGMGGLETCRRLKEQPQTRDLPIIFVTSLDSAQEETEALEAGAVDFITKPVNPAVVRARVRTHLMLQAQNRLLEALAYRDGLTQVANRRRMDEFLAAEWRRCRRAQAPIALVLAGIDRFKAFNDLYGRAAGDVCLRAVANALAGQFKQTQHLVARYGEDQFACVLPEISLGMAMTCAHHMLDAVRALGIQHAGSPHGIVTLSLGAASQVPDIRVTPGRLLEAADDQLYLAKHSGRNRVAGAAR